MPKTILLTIPPQDVRHGDSIRALDGNLIDPPMIAVGDCEHTADGVPRVPIQAAPVDGERNWYPWTSRTQLVTVERAAPRIFRTVEGAAKALAKELGLCGWPGGYLGFPGDVAPSEARGRAARLECAVEPVKRRDVLRYWRIRPATGEHALPIKGWFLLAHHLAAHHVIVIDTATMKGWKWADR